MRRFLVVMVAAGFLRLPRLAIAAGMPTASGSRYTVIQSRFFRCAVAQTRYYRQEGLAVEWRRWQAERRPSRHCLVAA